MPRKNFYSETDLDENRAVRGDLGIRREVLEKLEIGNFLARIVPADKAPPSPGVRSARHILRHLRGGHYPTDLGDHLWRVITDLDDVAAAAYRRLVRDDSELETSFSLQSYVEQVPNPDSRVGLAEEKDALGLPRARVVWTLGALDLKTALKGIEVLANEVGRLDLGRIRIVVAPEDGWPPDTGWGHHHMGTTRMHDDPRKGVVDRHARVHGMANLFVAGSSVFPTSGCATPTLTLVALALRLADRIPDHLRTL
jgi:choline dehydrogenase-like flavoprotein